MKNSKKIAAMVASLIACAAVSTQTAYAFSVPEKVVSVISNNGATVDPTIKDSNEEGSSKESSDEEDSSKEESSKEDSSKASEATTSATEPTEASTESTEASTEPTTAATTATEATTTKSTTTAVSSSEEKPSTGKSTEKSEEKTTEKSEDATSNTDKIGVEKPTTTTYKKVEVEKTFATEEAKSQTITIRKAAVKAAEKAVEIAKTGDSVMGVVGAGAAAAIIAGVSVACKRRKK